MCNRSTPMGVYFNGPGPANSFNVFIYTDNAGLPGTQVYSTLNQTWTQSGTTFTVNLSPAAVLTSGTYWIEIQANMTDSVGGEWGWTDRTVQSNISCGLAKPGRRLWCLSHLGALGPLALATQGLQIRFSGLTGQQRHALPIRSPPVPVRLCQE